MKKTTARRLLCVSVIVVLCSTPWFIGVATTKAPLFDSRINYLIGYSTILGWIGDISGRDESKAAALRIHEKKTLVEYGPVGKEVNGLLYYRLGTMTSGVSSYSSWSDSKSSGLNRIVIRKNQVSAFYQLLEQVKRELNTATELGAVIESAGPESVTFRRIEDNLELWVDVGRFRVVSETLVSELESEMDAAESKAMQNKTQHHKSDRAGDWGG